MARLLLKASRPRSVGTHVKSLFCCLSIFSPRKITDYNFLHTILGVHLNGSSTSSFVLTKARRRLFEKKNFVKKEQLKKRKKSRIETFLSVSPENSRFLEDEADWIKVGVVPIDNDIIRSGCFRISC